MKVFRFAAQAVLGWVILMASVILAGMIFPVRAPAMPHLLLWLAISEALVVLALLPATLRADWRGWRLFLALWAIPAMLSVTNMIEGVVFVPNIDLDWRALVLNTILTYAIAIAAWVVVFRKRGTATEPPIHLNPVHKIRNIMLGAAAYTFFYFVAGTFVFPFVRDFYANQRIPPGYAILALQLFVRGPILVGLCLLLLRMYRLPFPASMLAVAVGWAVLHGAAPLIIPNPYMPDHVRWAHFVEVTSSNLCFAAFVAWLWGKPRSTAAMEPALSS